MNKVVEQLMIPNINLQPLQAYQDTKKGKIIWITFLSRVKEKLSERLCNCLVPLLMKKLETCLLLPNLQKKKMMAFSPWHFDTDHVKILIMYHFQQSRDIAEDSVERM